MNEPPRPAGRTRGLIARLALVSVLLGCGDVGPNGAPRVGFDRMQEQARFDPYEGSAFFPDGRTMRSPPSHTVAREQAGTDLSRPRAPATPPATTDSLVTRGASQYGIYCAVCHGERADGQSVVARNMVEAPPPSLRSTRALGLSPSRLFTVISDGAGHMPSFASELSAYDRWAVIAYLATLDTAANTTLAPTPRDTDQGVAGP